jgi:hypothetical protein
MVIDPTTSIGKVRLIVGDYNDLAYLPDSVYQSTLDDNSDNIHRSSAIIAQYILGMLSQKTHRKMGQLEVYGAEAFQNYLAFLKFTVLNPNSIYNVAPLPYSPVVTSGKALEDFIYDFKHNYRGGTQSQWMAITAYPPRDDVEFPPFFLGGWVPTSE